MILKKLSLNNKGSQSQKGFALPTIILLTLVLSFVAYAALIQSNNNLNLAYKQSYLQVARVASKSAIDYAQEQFDNSICGDYDGTAEQDLIVNDRYRVTIKSEVLDTSADGLEKTIKGIGSVYLPKTSSNAKYVFDIRSEIVRTYALCKSPIDFDPVVWLDASDTSTLKKSSSSTTTVSYETNFGSLFSNSRDTLKERADNGTQPFLAWYSRALDLHTCDSTEFIGFLLCFFTSTKYLDDGVVFQNVNIPKDATIEDASIKFTGCYATSACSGSNTSGNVEHRTYGIYETPTNPHKNLFTSSGVNQLRNRLSDPALHTSAYNDTTTNRFPPGNTINLNVANIVQEMVNGSNYSAGNNLGFGIERRSGNGSRRAAKDKIKLSVTYTTGGGLSQANNSEGVTHWLDKSGNLNHAIHAHGSVPSRLDNQVNSKPVVRFAGGDLLSSLNDPSANKREMTVLAVIKPNFGASDSNGRIVSGMRSNQTNDTAGVNSIIPLMRNGTSAGFSSVYASLSPQYQTDYSCGTQCDNKPVVISSVFTSQDSVKTTATIKDNGASGEEKTDIEPTAPYTYTIDQLYFGGRRNGNMPGSGQDYLHGDFAEVVVYDKALTCREIESLEEYMRDKWNLYTGPSSTTCPTQTIPTL